MDRSTDHNETEGTAYKRMKQAPEFQVHLSKPHLLAYKQISGMGVAVHISK